jgi:large subunit ribosomal protein L13e
MIEMKPKIFKKDRKQRFGKGFSREELRNAGLSLTEALKLRIPVDSRRRTTYEENVEAVKAFRESIVVKARLKKKSKS